MFSTREITTSRSGVSTSRNARGAAYLTLSRPADTFFDQRGRGEAGYRAGLSSRRPRVQVPSLPLFFSGPRQRAQRAVAQLVARSVRDRKAGGSNPPSPTPAFLIHLLLLSRTNRTVFGRGRRQGQASRDARSSPRCTLIPGASSRFCSSHPPYVVLAADVR